MLTSTQRRRHFLLWGFTSRNIFNRVLFFCGDYFDCLQKDFILRSYANGIDTTTYAN